MLGKKAKIDFSENWVEYLFFVLLGLGFFLAISSGSAVVAYIVIFLCGMMGGRLLFRLKKELKTPWIIILTGFLIGFTFGSFYGDKRVIIISYIIGIWLSYFLHNKEIIKTTEF